MRNWLKWLPIPIIVFLLTAALLVSQFQFKANFTGIIAIALAETLDTSDPTLDIKQLTPQQIKEAALDTFTTSNITQKSVGQYELYYAGTKAKIEIGDQSKSTVFKPDLIISQWNGEASFKLIAPTDINEKQQLSSSLSNDKVTALNGDWQFEYKATEPKEGFNEFGGLDIIITAKIPPKSNRIEFTYDSSTVTPYLQPPFTEEWTTGQDLGDKRIVGKVTETDVYDEEDNLIAHRPAYAVGSLAFYANGKTNYEIGKVNYATGQVGILYAMKCNGQWCRWSVDKDKIVLTIPQEVIDKGDYPLVIQPVGDTFGYTTLGASESNVLASTTKMLYNCTNTNLPIYTGAVGTGSSMTVGGRTTAGHTAHVEMALYTNPSSTYGTLVDNSQTSEITIDTAVKGWWSANNSPTTAAVPYFLTIEGDANWSNYGYMAYTSNTNYVCDYRPSITYKTFPANWTTSIYTQMNSVLMSIYVTYTEAASLGITNDPSTKDFGTVANSGTFYAKGSAPSNPVSDNECTFTITETGGSICDIDVKGANSTGGAGMTLTSSAPGANEFRITVYCSGTNPASGVVVTTSDQELKDSLAASATIKWDFKLELGAATVPEQQSTTLTLTARTHS